MYRESYYDGIWRNHTRDSICVTSTSSKDSFFEDNWIKELGIQNGGGIEDSQQIHPESKTQLSRTVRLVRETQGLLTQEIGKDVLVECESTNSRTVRLVNGPPFSQSCVPMSVERVDKDSDAYENVDADQTRTVRLVSGQPTGLFTQVEEIDSW